MDNIILLPLPAPAVARVARQIRDRLDECLTDGEITEAGYSDAHGWLESWTEAQAARLGVVVVT